MQGILAKENYPSAPFGEEGRERACELEALVDLKGGVQSSLSSLRFCLDRERPQHV